jgi:hypothetical protein
VAVPGRRRGSGGREVLGGRGRGRWTMDGVASAHPFPAADQSTPVVGDRAAGIRTTPHCKEGKTDGLVASLAGEEAASSP